MHLSDSDCVIKNRGIICLCNYKCFNWSPDALVFFGFISKEQMNRPLLLEVFVSNARCREIENKLISGTWTKNTCRFLVVFGSYGFRRNYYFWHRKETDTDHVFLTHQSFQILMTDCKALWVWKIFNFGNILHCIDYECVISSLKDSHNSFSDFSLIIPSTYKIIFLSSICFNLSITVISLIMQSNTCYIYMYIEYCMYI